MQPGRFWSSALNFNKLTETRSPSNCRAVPRNSDYIHVRSCSPKLGSESLQFRHISDVLQCFLALESLSHGSIVLLKWNETKMTLSEAVLWFFRGKETSEASCFHSAAPSLKSDKQRCSGRVPSVQLHIKSQLYIKGRSNQTDKLKFPSYVYKPHITSPCLRKFNFMMFCGR